MTGIDFLHARAALAGESGNAIVVIAFILSQRNRLVVMLVSPDVARTAGIDVRRLNLLFLQTFALTIALGLRYLGVLLMGALIIIPPAHREATGEHPDVDVGDCGRRCDHRDGGRQLPGNMARS